MLDTIYMQILDMSKTASIVILAVLLARLILKKAPKVFSYAIWAVVLFRLLCPVTFESPASAVPELPSVSQGYTLSEEPISLWGASEAAYQAVGDALNGGLGIQHIRTTEKDETGMNRYVTTDWWSVWILFGQYVWVAGMAAMLVYSAVSYRKLREKLLVVVPLRDNIFIADDIKSPFVVGLFCPKIYLPCNLGEREQEYIILHEQHHIKRLDHIIKALAFLALTVHWFNPLVWLAFVLAGRDMEMSCDEAVIRKLGSDVRAEYSASLLTLATGRRIIAGTPLAFGEGDTKGRIRNLAGWKKPAGWIVAAGAAICIVFAMSCMADPVNYGDHLKLVEIEQFSPVGNPYVRYRIDLSHQPLSGTIYAEQWKKGVCVRSAPVALTKNTEEILAVFDVRRENGAMVGVDVRIETGVNGASLLTYFAFPEERSISGGGFDAHELKKIIQVAAGDELILAVMHIYEGGSVLGYDPQTLVNDTEHWKDVDHMIVIRACFSSGQLDDQNEEAVLWRGDIIPGTYVPYQCIYMNPLSSYAAIGGDSGCKYVVGEDYFTTIYRDNSISINAKDPSADIAQNRIEVKKWKWQKFPYTDEEWASLYWPKGIWSIENISGQYSEMLYQPLTSNKFLLKMDSSLWLVDISNDPKVGTYIWSIYSLVPESAMGAVQWEYAPELSSKIALFPFNFDLEHTEISAYCKGGLLGVYGTSPNSFVTVRTGETLYWSPVDEDGNVVTSAIISFSARQGDDPTYNGTIYIEGAVDSDGRMIYTAAIVGTGLHLAPDAETHDGVVSARNHGT